MWFDNECFIFSSSLSFPHVIGQTVVFARKNPCPRNKVIFIFMELPDPVVLK